MSDPFGLHTLENEDALGDWVFDRMRDRLGPRIVEVGCGIGTYTRRLIDAGDVVGFDPDPASVEHARALVGDKAELHVGAIEDVEPRLGGPFDSAVCINVLEHIPDHVGALEAIGRLLRPGGVLHLLVPAHPWLYGSLDVTFEHCRRYRRRDLGELLERAGFRHDGVPYFNMLGIPGWFVAAKVLKQPDLRRGLVKAYKAIAPPFRFIEDRLGAPIGLSLFTAAERP